jgi:hypothetical protein
MYNFRVWGETISSLEGKVVANTLTSKLERGRVIVRSVAKVI